MYTYSSSSFKSIVVVYVDSRRSCRRMGNKMTRERTSRVAGANHRALDDVMTCVGFRGVF